MKHKLKHNKEVMLIVGVLVVSTYLFSILIDGDLAEFIVIHVGIATLIGLLCLLGYTHRKQFARLFSFEQRKETVVEKLFSIDNQIKTVKSRTKGLILQFKEDINKMELLLSRHKGIEDFIVIQVEDLIFNTAQKIRAAKALIKYMEDLSRRIEGLLVLENAINIYSETHYRIATTDLTYDLWNEIREIPFELEYELTPLIEGENKPTNHNLLESLEAAGISLPLETEEDVPVLVEQLEEIEGKVKELFSFQDPNS